MSFLDWDPDEPSELDVRVVLGIYHDSPDEPRRVRLLDVDGQERARLSGVLTYEEGEGWVRFTAEEGGLSASLTIRVDDATRCTTMADGTMTGTLPGGEEWISTPLGEVEDEEEGKQG